MIFISRSAYFFIIYFMYDMFPIIGRSIPSEFPRYLDLDLSSCHIQRKLEQNSGQFTESVPLHWRKIDRIASALRQLL